MLSGRPSRKWFLSQFGLIDYESREGDVVATVSNQSGIANAGEGV